MSIQPVLFEKKEEEKGNGGGCTGEARKPESYRFVPAPVAEHEDVGPHH